MHGQDFVQPLAACPRFVLRHCCSKFSLRYILQHAMPYIGVHMRLGMNSSVLWIPIYENAFSYSGVPQYLGRHYQIPGGAQHLGMHNHILGAPLN
jgi:hypothetical protein